MILEKETTEKFGRLPIRTLDKWVVSCDYCGVLCDKTEKNRRKANIDIAKDACSKCKFIKREEKSLKLYGVKNSAQRDDVKLSDINWDDHKDKITQLYSEGYSVPNIAKKLGLPKTSLDRKIKEWELKSDETFASHRDKTMRERYGEDYIEKKAAELKQFAQDNYGVDNVFQSEEIKAKIKETNLDKYGVEHHMKDKDRAKEVVQKGLQTRIDRGDVFIHEGKTIPMLAEAAGFSRSHFHSLVKKFGIDKAITMQPRQSSLETTFEEWLIKEDIKYKKQVRVGTKYADFQIGNIIIECDGLYWHSERITEKNYHKEKRDLYLENGFTPLFFYEDEINNKFPIVQSMILNKLGKCPNKIFARKTAPVIGGANKEFFEENHLMGKGKGEIFSLLYDGEPVAAIQICRLKDNDYDISRFCCKKNHSVIGGFSKLLKLVEQTLKMDSLKTFIDLRYGKGGYLEDLGFKRGNPSLSFHWTNGERRFHRLKFRGATGYDKGLARIWDCGQLPFTKEY